MPIAAATADESTIEHCNDIHLVGRVAANPVERVLPSGDLLLSWRLVVDRPAADRQSSRTTCDTIDCIALRPGVRRKAAGWGAGDVVEVAGTLRRRFWRSESGPHNTYEVLATSARRLARAG